MYSLNFVQSQISSENWNAGCTHCSLFLHNQVFFWKENLVQILLMQLLIHWPFVTLFSYNSYYKQLIFLVVKKPDACLGHKFPDFEKHLVENPIFSFLESLFSFPFTIFLHLSRSWGFLFLLIAKIAGFDSWKQNYLVLKPSGEMST